MKKLILIIAMLLGFAGMSLAQFTANANVDVSAKIVSTLSITATSGSELKFGTLAQGATTATINAKTDPKAVELDIHGTPGAGITVSWNATTELGDASGHTIPFTPAINGLTATTATQGSSNSISSSDKVNLEGTFPSTGSGNYYLWVGGQLGSTPGTIDGNQALGNYSTAASNGVPLTVTVTYQ